jgi:phosphoglycolate phosphatase-like HAD superfamily hydrolase
VVRLALFDIDGTLIRTGGAGVRAFARTLECQFGIPNGTGHVRFGGRTDPSLVREIFEHHGIPTTPENLQRFLDTYVFILDALLAPGEGAACPGVHDLLRALRGLAQPPAIGLLTGNIRLGAEIKLRRYGLWEEFVVGGFGDDDEDRDVIAAVARDRGSVLLGSPLRGNEILVVGDTPRDIQCGRAIGARILAVATGGASFDELRAHQPDWLLEDLRAADAAAVCA